MSVLIKMDMSKEKAIAIVIHPDGTAYTAEMTAGVCTKYLADCTAIEVPAHGRLIDADALAVNKFAGAEHDISIADGGACYRRGWNDAIETIMENAETIIGEK